MEADQNAEVLLSQLPASTGGTTIDRVGRQLYIGVSTL